jgi:hypothetical protein
MNSVEALTDRPTSDPSEKRHHGRHWSTTVPGSESGRRVLISCITACGICDFCRRGMPSGVTR